MDAITKIIRAKDKYKTLDIPKEFIDKDVKVTFEPVNNEINYNAEEKIKQLNELYELARKKNIKIPKDMDINKLMNDMNNAIL